MCRKLPPTLRPLATVTLPPSRSAETTRRRSVASRYTKRRIKTGQDHRPLRVSDKDDPAPVVVVGQIVVERGEHAVVRRQRIGAGDPGRVLECGERDLRVDRREHSTNL
jgi:hypothetical protein